MLLYDGVLLLGWKRGEMKHELPFSYLGFEKCENDNENTRSFAFKSGLFGGFLGLSLCTPFLTEAWSGAADPTERPNYIRPFEFDCKSKSKKESRLTILGAKISMPSSDLIRTCLVFVERNQGRPRNSPMNASCVSGN